MSFTEKLEQVEAANANRLCALGRSIASLDDTERVAFEKLASSDGMSAERLRGILLSEGFHHAKETIASHLKGKCLCAS